MEPWIIIPAYNEEKKIVEVISALKEQSYHNIVVIDDGSKDFTYQQVQQTNVKILRHLINRGQGAALKTGLDYALENNAEIIVTFDADGQHQPQDIKNLILPIQERKADVVLGSRFLKNSSNTPLLRKIFLKCGAGIFLILYNIKLTDSHNGLRAFSRQAAQRINITQDKMEHASEIIDEISRHRLKYKEVPVTIKYTNYSIQHGQKTSNAFNILLKMFLHKLVR